MSNPNKRKVDQLYAGENTLAPISMPNKKSRKDFNNSKNPNQNHRHKSPTPLTPDTRNRLTRYFVNETKIMLNIGSKETFKGSCSSCGNTDHDESVCPYSYCTDCGTLGHHPKSCPHKFAKPCNNCGRKGHTDKKCPIKQFELNEEIIKKDASTLICIKCGKIGHLDCSNPEKRQKKFASCFNCGFVGHFGMECPHKSIAEVEDAYIKEQQDRKNGYSWPKGRGKRRF